MPQESTTAHGYFFAALLVTVGAVLISVGCVCYMLVGHVLGLPVAPDEYAEAREIALRLGPGPIARAGLITLVGDFLLAAGAIALVPRRRGQGSDLESAGWALAATSAVIAMVFDSLFGCAIYPLAASGETAAFTAVKAWFDMLFGAGMVPFGLAGMALFGLDVRRESPLVPRAVAWAGILTGVLSVVVGLGFTTGLFVFSRAIGVAISAGSFLFAGLGFQLARRER